MKSWNYLWIVALLLCGVGTANAQNKPLSKNEPPASSANLIEATREYKANSEDLLKLQEDEIKKATQKLEQLRQLVADGLVAKNELAAAEDSVAALQATLEATRKKIGDSDQMIAEIQSEEIRKTQVGGAGRIGQQTAQFRKADSSSLQRRRELVDRSSRGNSEFLQFDFWTLAADQHGRTICNA